MKQLTSLLLTGIIGFAADVPQEGLKAEMAGKWNEAANIYENILIKEPKRIDLYVRLSDIYAKEKRFNEAANALKSAIAIEPNRADLYSRLASVYAVLNQPEQALLYRAKTLEIEPNNVTYLVAHARIANWLKKSEVAAESFKKALSLDPANEDLLLLLSQSSEWARKDKDAIGYYQKYLQNNPNNLKIWLILANLQELNGDLNASNETLKTAYSLFIKDTGNKDLKQDINHNTTIPILEYHCIDETSPNTYWITTAEFEAQIDELIKNGYQSVSMDTIEKAINGEIKLPQKPVVITFDDGCQNLYTKAFPILKNKGYTAQVYVVTDSMGNNDSDRKNSSTARLGENGEASLTYYLTWPEIKELASSGWGIGSHSRAHMDMSELNATSQLHELLYSKLAILAYAQLNSTAFSYPYGYANGDKNLHSLLATSGYTTAVASTGGRINPGNIDRYNIPRIMVYGPKPTIDPASKGVSVTPNPLRPTDSFMSKIEPNDAEQAYENGEFLLASKKYDEALSAINEAVRLSPNTIRYVRAKLEIASVANKPEIAADAAQRIYEIEPTDDNLLLLARTNLWGNRLNESAKNYSMYLERHDDKKEVWIEYAQLQTWLGKYADALDYLELYKDKFGATDPYYETKAETLSWGNRPHRAFEILDPRIQAKPNDYNTNYTRTIALDKNNQFEEAIASMERVEQISPKSTADNTFLRKYITTKFRPSITAGFELYNDSYDVSTRMMSLYGEYYLSPLTSINTTIKRDDLRATEISGFAQDNGQESADYKSGSVGFTHRVSPELAFRGSLGGASAEQDHNIIYSIGGLWSPRDDLSIDFSHSHDYYLISPRSVGRGITDNATLVSLEWEPTMRTAISMLGRYDLLSDDNKRWEVDLAPRWEMARTQYWNLDIGPAFRFYGYDKQYDDHGYYAPELVQNYYLTGYLNCKISQDDSVNFVVSGGAVHDSYADMTKPSGAISIEGIFGLYRDWMLKANAAVDYTPRFNDQSYTGTNLSIFLTRRF